MNVEIGTESPIFLFWDYLFRNFGILSLQFVCGINVIIWRRYWSTEFFKSNPIFCLLYLLNFQSYHVVLRGPDQVHHVRPLHAAGERCRHCHGCHWRNQLRQAANQQLSRQKYLLGDFLEYKEHLADYYGRLNAKFLSTLLLYFADFILFHVYKIRSLLSPKY